MQEGRPESPPVGCPRYHFSDAASDLGLSNDCRDGLDSGRPAHTLGQPLPGMPTAASPVTLRAVTDPETGAASFSFAGAEVPPVLHTSPGLVLRVDYVNAISTHSTEMCVDGPCTNMTNLHFHGLHVSPASPQGYVISTMAEPGQSLRYKVQIPADQPPGSTGITPTRTERATDRLSTACPAP